MFDYDGIWQGAWNDETKYAPAARHRRRLIVKLVGGLPHESVLDLGCGDGTMLAALAARVPATYSGVDISGPAIELARKRMPQATLWQSDLANIQFPSVYDVGVLSEVLEHLDDDKGLLCRLAPYVRHVVISVPGGPADKVDRRYGHVRNYVGNALRVTMEESGFEVVHCRHWGWPFFELVQAMLHAMGNSAVTSAGRYGWPKRTAAWVLYVLFFLNILPAGTQVFAVGRSRKVGSRVL